MGSRRQGAEVRKHLKARKGDGWKNLLIYMLFGALVGGAFALTVYAPSRSSVACERYNLCWEHKGGWR